MKQLQRIILFAFILPFLISASNVQLAEETSAKVIVDKMLAAIDNIKTLSYTMKGWERLDGSKQQYNEVDVKLNVNPQRIFLLSKAPPNKGVQILYNPDLWGDKAYVNAGRLIPNLKLDPFGSRMRNLQHHTILNTGFATFGSIIKNALDRQKKEMPDGFDKYCRIDGSITWNGIACYKIIVTDPTFKYVEYTVKEGDDVEKLERQKHICGYLIIEKNSNVKDFWSLKPGMSIKIPSSYAKKTTLYVDKKTFLPLVQIMEDEVGPFEKYEFYDVKVNPQFAPNEFTDKFEGYSF